VRIGPYEVLDTVARGAQGQVFRARGPGGEDVAVKVAHDRPGRPMALERIAREERLQGLLHEGQGFVPLLDAGRSPYGSYLVMPYLAGGSLDARLGARDQLPVGETIALGAALARGLGQAHALGVVHRDLKPGNVLFTADGRPLIGDLGLAKHYRGDAPGASQSQRLSETGELRGTFGYLAPEQIEDSKSVGPQADVFSLGALLYRCLAGELPFPVETLPGYWQAMEAGTPPSLSGHNPGCPSWLSRVIARCLRMNPDDRYADGLALYAALVSEGRAGREPGRVVRAGAALACGLAVVAGVYLSSRTPTESERASVDEIEVSAASSAPAPSPLAPFRARGTEALSAGPAGLRALLRDARQGLSMADARALAGELAEQALALPAAERDRILDTLLVVEPLALQRPALAPWFADQVDAALAPGDTEAALLAVSRTVRADPERPWQFPALRDSLPTEASLALARGDAELWLRINTTGLRLGLSYGLFPTGIDARFPGGLGPYLARLEEEGPEDPERSLYYALHLMRHDLQGAFDTHAEKQGRAELGAQALERVLAGGQLAVLARPLALEGLGIHQLTLDLYDEAKQTLLLALAAHHARPDECYYRLMQLETQRGGYEAAERYARHMISTREDRLARTERGGSALAEGRPPGLPLESFANSDTPVQVGQSVRQQLLDVLLAGRRDAEAGQVMDELVDLDPSSLQARLARAKLDWALRGDPQALEFFRSEVERDPEVRIQARKLQQALERRGDDQRAEALGVLHEDRE
jgi:tetratricopeptide (TPR) repeat protein/tRNA A-37 threonylcarbamoyl transferase component Bud32